MYKNNFKKLKNAENEKVLKFCPRKTWKIYFILMHIHELPVWLNPLVLRKNAWAGPKRKITFNDWNVWFAKCCLAFCVCFFGLSCLNCMNYCALTEKLNNNSHKKKNFENKLVAERKKKNAKLSNLHAILQLHELNALNVLNVQNARMLGIRMLNGGN